MGGFDLAFWPLLLYLALNVVIVLSLKAVLEGFKQNKPLWLMSEDNKLI